LISIGSSLPEIENHNKKLPLPWRLSARSRFGEDRGGDEGEGELKSIHPSPSQRLSEPAATSILPQKGGGD